MRVQWVSHLQTTHYHLGLICSHCVDYFATSSDSMHCHTQLCKPAAAGNDNNYDREESPPDYEDEDNSKEDYILDED